MDRGTKWREDVRVGFTVGTVLLLVSAAAALWVRLLGY